MTLIVSALLTASAVFLLQEPQEPQEPQQETSIWTTDFAAAKAEAAKSGKDLLLNFTGSDWCIWCKRLKAEVFDEEAFQTEEPQHFVLVTLDYPQDKSGQSEAEIEQNEKLSGEFGVRGFPTIYLCDAQGRPYAQTGYQEGGAENYVSHLADLRGVRVARDAALEKADGAEGEARATFLAEAVDAMDSDLQRHYKPWIEEIVKIGSPELKERFQARLREMEMEARLEATQEAVNKHAQAGEWDEAIAAVDKLIADVGEDLEVMIHQQVLVLKGRLMLEKDDTEGAIAALRAAVALDPEGEMAQRINGMVEEIQRRADAEKETPKDGE